MALDKPDLSPRELALMFTDERRHQTLKNRILLDHYFMPSALEQAIADFVQHYNHRRYHESLKNLTVNQDDPEFAEIEAFVRESRQTYFRYVRPLCDWGVFVLRPKCNF